MVLAFSCFGLNFGMIGHGMMQMDGMESLSAMHECCGGVDEDLGSSGAASIDHHSATIVALVSLDLLSLILVLTFVYASVVPIVSMYIQLRLYARQWLERWSYFSLYLNRLFSQGILHPQVW